MITIKITSDTMTASQSFNTDTKALAYLKKIKKVHASILTQKAGPRPKRGDFGRYGQYRYKDALEKWKQKLNSSGVKVTIETN